jgi:large subunit ribosomal protein L3
VREIRCDAKELGGDSVGAEIRVGDVFSDGDYVDVSGTSVGKGFQGVVRRFHTKGQPATRGTHEYRRHIGSVGCRKFPGRIFKNKRMPGRMGGESVTLQNLQVVGVNPEQNLLLVKGGVPGSKGGLVVIKKAIKRTAAA